MGTTSRPGLRGGCADPGSLSLSRSRAWRDPAGVLASPHFPARGFLFPTSYPSPWSEGMRVPVAAFSRPPDAELTGGGGWLRNGWGGEECAALLPGHGSCSLPRGYWFSGRGHRGGLDPESEPRWDRRAFSTAPPSWALSLNAAGCPRPDILLGLIPRRRCQPPGVLRPGNRVALEANSQDLLPF